MYVNLFNVDFPIAVFFYRMRAALLLLLLLVTLINIKRVAGGKNKKGEILLTLFPGFRTY